MEDNKTGSYFQEIKSQAKQSYILVSLGKVPGTFFFVRRILKNAINYLICLTIFPFLNGDVSWVSPAPTSPLCIEYAWVT